MDSIELFNPKSLIWVEGGQLLPEPTSGAGFVRSGGELILVGGGYSNDKVWVFGQEGWGEGQLDGLESGLYQGNSIVVDENVLTCE